MFQNLKDLIAKLKLIRELINTKDLDKIGDMLKDLAKLFGYEAYGNIANDMLDAIAVNNWQKVTYTVGSLLQQLSVNLPDGSINFGLLPRMSANNQSMTPSLDYCIDSLEQLDKHIDNNNLKPTIPLNMYPTIGAAVLEALKAYKTRNIAP